MTNGFKPIIARDDQEGRMIGEMVMEDITRKEWEAE